MSTQVGTIHRPFGPRSLAMIVAAAAVAIGITVAILAFQDSAAPTRPQTATEQGVATEPLGTTVQVNTPSETGLIKGGLQPRPYVATVTAAELEALHLVSSGVDATGTGRRTPAITLVKGGLQPLPYDGTR